MAIYILTSWQYLFTHSFATCNESVDRLPNGINESTHSQHTPSTAVTIIFVISDACTRRFLVHARVGGIFILPRHLIEYVRMSANRRVGIIQRRRQLTMISTIRIFIFIRW